MTTKETIENYFAALRAGDPWEDRLAEELTFTSHTSPLKRVIGREAFLQSTSGFYGMITSLHVRDLIVDGDSVCACTTYELQPPVGPAFTSNVAEVFTVRDDKIAALSIYFDTAPYPT